MGAKGLCQAHEARCLSLAQGRWGDAADHNVLAIGLVTAMPEDIQADLRGGTCIASAAAAAAPKSRRAASTTHARTIHTRSCTQASKQEQAYFGLGRAVRIVLIRRQTNLRRELCNGLGRLGRGNVDVTVRVGSQR